VCYDELPVCLSSVRGYEMPDEHEIDSIFGDMSQYPVDDAPDTPAEAEAHADILRGDTEVIPEEWYVEQFVERFGYTPKIKEHNAFVFYVLSNFNPMWRDEAVEIEHERQ
jgi:hypothetical protein